MLEQTDQTAQTGLATRIQNESIRREGGHIWFSGKSHDVLAQAEAALEMSRGLKPVFPVPRMDGLTHASTPGLDIQVEKVDKSTKVKM